MFYTFLRVMSITTGVIWLFMALPLYLFANLMVFVGILVGWILAATCFICGFYAIDRNFSQTFRTFMIVMFRGMLIRLFFVGIAFVMLIKLTELHVGSFLFSLMGFYTVYMIIELYFVNSRLHSREEITG